MARIALKVTPKSENSGMSLIEQVDIPWENQISVQPEPSAVIQPNSGFQQEALTLTDETDKGTSSEEKSCSDSGSEPDSD